MLSNPVDYGNPSEIENALDKVDWNLQDVLVGSVRSEAQYLHCIDKKYYYVPAKYITADMLPVCYVAMCRSATIGNAGIFNYGEVIRTSKIKRSVIPFPLNRNNDNEMYYAFVINRWNPLNTPIRIRNERVYEPRLTNLFLLENSKETFELFNIKSAEEYRLLTGLRNISDKSYTDCSESICRINNQYVIQAYKDCFLLKYSDGIILNRYPFEVFQSNPKYVISNILQTCRSDEQ